MTSAAALPNPQTPAQVLGNLVAIDQNTATAVLRGAPIQAHPPGLGVVAALDVPTAQLAIGIRRPAFGPFTY